VEWLKKFQASNGLIINSKKFTMNKKHNSFKPLLPGCFIGCMLILNACGPSRLGLKAPKMKARIYWGVEFKDNTSDSEKTTALIALDKYVLDSVLELKNPYIFQFNNTIGNGAVPGGLGAMEFGFGGGDESGQEATGTKLPPGPRPHYDNISPFINDIKIISRKQFINIYRNFQNITSRSGGERIQ